MHLIYAFRIVCTIYSLETVLPPTGSVCGALTDQLRYPTSDPDPAEAPQPFMVQKHLGSQHPCICTSADVPSLKRAYRDDPGRHTRPL